MTKSKGNSASATPKAQAARSGRFIEKESRARQPATASVADGVSASGGGFLAKTRLKKAGGSLVMTMPAAARNLLQLVEGQEMAVLVEGSRVVVEPMPVATAGAARVRRPKYTLDELLADADAEAPLSDEERAWRDVPPAGRELW